MQILCLAHFEKSPIYCFSELSKNLMNLDVVFLINIKLRNVF